MMPNPTKPQMKPLILSRTSLIKRLLLIKGQHIKNSKSRPILFNTFGFAAKESLADDGLVYDPIAAQACKRCQLAPECLTGELVLNNNFFTRH